MNIANPLRWTCRVFPTFYHEKQCSDSTTLVYTLISSTKLIKPCTDFLGSRPGRHSKWIWRQSLDRSLKRKSLWSVGESSWRGINNGQALHSIVRDNRTIHPLIAMANSSRIRHSNLSWWVRKKNTICKGRWIMWVFSMLPCSILHTNFL